MKDRRETFFFLLVNKFTHKSFPIDDHHPRLGRSVQLTVLLSSAENILGKEYLSYFPKCPQTRTRPLLHRSADTHTADENEALLGHNPNNPVSQKRIKHSLTKEPKAINSNNIITSSIIGKAHERKRIAQDTALGLIS